VYIYIYVVCCAAAAACLIHSSIVDYRFYISQLAAIRIYIYIYIYIYKVSSLRFVESQVFFASRAEAGFS
jgi:hypothetical protein